MTIDLSTFSTVATSLFVKIVLPTETVLVSDFNRPITLQGDTYTGIGQLMTITESTSELRVSNQEVTIGLSGLPVASLPLFLNTKIKGAVVSVLRAFFDPTTGQLLSIEGNPTGKFQGIISNYAIEEVYEGVDASLTINLICSSRLGQIENRIAGRRTSSADQKLFYPGDTSMDRVAKIANANLNFGIK